MKKEIELEKVLNVVLILSWVFMGILLVIYIMFGSKALLNSDSAFIVDYSLEQIKTKSLFPTGWYETNDFWIYSLIPIITPLIKIGFTLFAARQTAVLIQSIVLFILLFKLFYEKGSRNNFLIPGLLIISGLSGQILFEVFGDATYGTIIVYMLLLLYFAIQYLTKLKKRYIVLIIISLTLLTMCSLRFPIYITAPLIVVLIYLYLKNGVKKEYISLFIVFALSTIIGYILNKYLTLNLLFVSIFDRAVVVNEQGLANNFFRIFFQYFWIYGATNLNVYSLTIINSLHLSSNSVLMAFVFVRFLFCIFTIIVPIKLIKKMDEFSLKEKIIYVYIVSLTVIIIFFLLIGSMAEWYRYLTPVLFFLALLYIPFYKYFIKEKRMKVIFIMFIILFCIYSLYMNLHSWYNKENYYQELADFLVENNLTFGYSYVDSEHNLYHLLSEGRLRIVLVERKTLENYKWLASKEWFEEDYHKGKIFFMRKEEERSLECESKADKVLRYQLEDVTYNIYVFEDANILRENLKITN